MATVDIFNTQTQETFELEVSNSEELEIYLRRNIKFLNNNVPFGNLAKCLQLIEDDGNYLLDFSKAEELFDSIPTQNIPEAIESDLNSHALSNLGKSESSVLEEEYGIKPDKWAKVLGNNLKPFNPKLVAPKVISPWNQDGITFSKAIRSAFDANKVHYVHLGGKHSNGSMVAFDPSTKIRYLLKPGFGESSPAAGIRETPYTQSQRETAFYHASVSMDLGNYLPECQMLLFDGKEVACIKMLPDYFVNYVDFTTEDQFLGREVLENYLVSGTLHKWAVMDYVLGNVDRHSSNLMVGRPKGNSSDGNKGVTVRLIDHGSTLAGLGFDPANDPSSYLPYYLRMWSSISKFQRLIPKDRFHQMPTTSLEGEKILRNWFKDLDLVKLAWVLESYGINPQPMIARATQIHLNMANGRLDEAINKLWAGYDNL